MRLEVLTVLALSLATCGMVGCGEKSAPAPAASAGQAEDPKTAAEIAKLPEEEQAIATAQKFCAVETNSALGSMGKPFKVMIEGKPVFLCCAGCEDEALKEPQKTLAKVEELKQAAKTESAQ